MESSRALLDQRCSLLRSLHVAGAPLVLPNAWDAASARAVVAAGFPVVATTSGGVAATLGYADGQDAPPDQMFAAATRIARSVDTPVTIDSEAGYGLAPEVLVERLLDAGAAGCNLEDSDHAAGGLIDAQRHAEWLAAVRRAALGRGFGLVINARIDVFIGQDVQNVPDLLHDVISRARAYIDAGVDCVFPIVLSDVDVIRALLDAIQFPVNIFGVPPAPSYSTLKKMGVARISYGSSLHRQSMRELATNLGQLTRWSRRR
ncbi:MAG TPA: isocitrate lyase/phosphoenolpyruvate mutase family protein [Candidatus Saccharimonadales bacterium]|nr:isocitrate lyase/phosphoenolpyruvate mutase family protein [Candidatus Saccharimonadales bacterium]